MTTESTEPVEPTADGRQPKGGTVRPDPFVRGLNSGGGSVAGGPDQPDPFVRGLASGDGTDEQPDGTD